MPCGVTGARVWSGYIRAGINRDDIGKGPVMELIEETPYRYRIDPHGDMRQPGVVFASQTLLDRLGSADQSLEQVANVATLPGVVEASYAMPDVHWGYGFPIGGVVGTDVRNGGVISPGGVGFDISCGIRLLTANLDRSEFEQVKDPIMRGLDKRIPRGKGRGAVRPLSGREELDALLHEGARYLVDRGDGEQRDLDRCEDTGRMQEADSEAVSERAKSRGWKQAGSLGSGNHFLEIQAVDEVFDEHVADTFGLRHGQICIMIHSGSRGLGHQICTDHVGVMENVMPRYDIQVPDKQLACAPVESPEARQYLAGMAAGANFAKANRHILGRTASAIFQDATGDGLDLVYDVSHNLAKLENHDIDGETRTLCVHRKGATLALPPGHPDLPADLRPVGQPVLVPGSMGTASYVLAGVADNPAFHSTCHGAGRVQSRQQAARAASGEDVKHRLQREGITVRGASSRVVAEESPEAYKDVTEVVGVAEGAGLARPIARLVPLGVVKG